MDRAVNYGDIAIEKTMALYQAFPRNDLEYPQNGGREIIIEIPTGSRVHRRHVGSRVHRGSIVGLVADRIPLKMPVNR